VNIAPSDWTKFAQFFKNSQNSGQAKKMPKHLQQTLLGIFLGENIKSSPKCLEIFGLLHLFRKKGFQKLPKWHTFA
jgi:hypothetical protein